MSQVRAAELPRSAVHRSTHAVGEAEVPQQGLAAGEHLLLAGDRLLTVGRHRQQLDLVELVDPQQPPRVLAGRPRLPAEARRVRHVAQRQVGAVEDLVAVQRRERHLGRGDGPQVVALDVVGLVGELGEVPGRGHRLGAHQRGRADLLVRVGVAVEAELHQRPQQPGAPAPVHGEHRARDLGGPLVVEDRELGADLPVRDPLVLAVGAGVVALGAQDDVVLLARAARRVLARQVGEAEQGDPDLVGQHAGGLGQRLLLVAERAALGHERLCLVRLPLPPQAPDLLRQGLDPAADLVALGDDPALLGVQRHDLVDGVGRAGSPEIERGLDRIGLAADPADVEHEGGG